MKRSIFHTLSLRAKRSNLGPLSPLAFEIASSPAAPRNDSLSRRVSVWIWPISIWIASAVNRRIRGSRAAFLDGAVAPRSAMMVPAGRNFDASRGTHRRIRHNGRPRFQGGAASSVVWNPWAEKAAAIVDLGDPAWRGMVCVEAGNIADNEVRLAADAEHRMSTAISADASR
jgi:hypothetical protein